MDSWELARLLLSHRANDVQISVIIEDNDGNVSQSIIHLRDHKEESDYHLDKELIVQYNALGDYITINAGTVYVQSFLKDED